MELEITDYSSAGAFLAAQPGLPEGQTASSAFQRSKAARPFGQYKTVFNQDRVIEFATTRDDAAEFLVTLRGLVRHLCPGPSTDDGLKFVVNTASAAFGREAVYTVHVTAPLSASIRLTKLSGEWEFFVEFSGKVVNPAEVGARQLIRINNSQQTRYIDV